MIHLTLDVVFLEPRLGGRTQMPTGSSYYSLLHCHRSREDLAIHLLDLPPNASFDVEYRVIAEILHPNRAGDLNGLTNVRVSLRERGCTIAYGLLIYRMHFPRDVPNPTIFEWMPEELHEISKLYMPAEQETKTDYLNRLRVLENEKQRIARERVDPRTMKTPLELGELPWDDRI